MNKTEKAEKFAREKHEGQFRDNGVTPYITHPEAVVNILKKYGFTEAKILATAWLHDTLEDTRTSFIELKTEFGISVAQMVFALSHHKFPNEDSMDAAERMARTISMSPAEVQIVKVADRFHNLKSIGDGSWKTNRIQRYLDKSRKLLGDWFVSGRREDERRNKLHQDCWDKLVELERVYFPECKKELDVIMIKKSPYIRIGVFSIEEVLPYIAKDKKLYNGRWVNMGSKRYKVFRKDNCTCVKCGIRGLYFALEKGKTEKEEVYHFNLYGKGKDGNEVLFTKDHIFPISRGGNNKLNNLQTMCSKCNFEKGNEIPHGVKLKGCLK